MRDAVSHSYECEKDLPGRLFLKCDLVAQPYFDDAAADEHFEDRMKSNT